MPNLHAFLEILPEERPSRESAATVASKEVEALMKKLKTSRDFLKEIGQQQLIPQVVDSSVAKIADLRKKVFVDSLRLPPLLAKSPVRDSYSENLVGWKDDYLTKFSKSPRVSMSSMRTLADKLGMVLIPYVALNNQSVNTSAYDTRSSIRSFLSASRECDMDTYVMCPISLYSIVQHASDKGSDSLSMYSLRYEAALMSVSMQIPLFRMITSSIENLNSRVTSLEDASCKMQEQIRAFQVQLNRLQDQLDRETKARAVAEARNEELRRQYEEMNFRLFRAEDPLMFALKKGQDLLSDGVAIVGPAWGPDLPGVLIEMAGLKEVPGQSNKLLSLW